jgi:hypothetical protein
MGAPSVRYLATAIAVGLLATACSPSKRGRSRFPVAVTNPDDSGADKVIEKLSAKVGEYEAALAERDFDEAEDRLDELEDMLEDASTAVITHPDYNRISTASRAGRARIRKMKGEEASTALLDRTRRALEETERLLSDIEEHGPTDEWLERLGESVEKLRDIYAEGEGHRTDPGYAELMPRIDAALATARDNEGRYKWWLEVRGDLDKPLEEAVAAEQEADNAKPARAVEANDRAAEKFERCVEVLGEAKSKWGYNPDRALGSPFGPLTLDELVQVCRTRAAAARDQVAHLHWKRDVSKIAERVTAALAAIETKKKATETLEANEKAADVLADCMNELRNADEAPGYDAGVEFVTHVGKRNALGLQQTCADVRRDLIDLQPTLRWRIGVEELRAYVEQVRADTKKAVAEEDLDDQIEKLTDLSSRFDECSQRAGALAMKKHPWSNANPNRAEIKAMVSLERACRKELNYVGGLLENAKTKARRSRDGSTRKHKKGRP